MLRDENGSEEIRADTNTATFAHAYCVLIHPSRLAGLILCRPEESFTRDGE